MVYLDTTGPKVRIVSQNTDIVANSDDTDLTFDRRWNLVRKVFEAMGKPGVNNIRTALEYTQVPTSSFYVAINDPAVRARTVEWMQASDRAILARIEASRYAIVQNLIDIASSNSREAVAAARTLEEIKAGVVKDLASDEQPGKGRHPARALLESAKKATLRRTTIVEEVEIGPDEPVSDGNPVIDMEP